MRASSGCFECEQCAEQELRCGPCTRERFCRRCATERAARSTKKSGEKYRRTDRARELHRACSLASYHRRGKEQRRQRLSQEAASQGPAPPGVAQPPDEAATDEGKDPVHSRECLTQKTVGEAAGRPAIVGPATAASAVQAPVSRGEEELVDGKAPSSRSPGDVGDEEAEAPENGGRSFCDVGRSRMAPRVVLTTVAQVRAALREADEAGIDDVVLWGRCSRCGRAGRIVHFEGLLRARAQALE